LVETRFITFWLVIENSILLSLHTNDTLYDVLLLPHAGKGLPLNNVFGICELNYAFEQPVT